MKGLKDKDSRHSNETIYLPLVTNWKINWLSGHGWSCGIIWGLSNTKRHTFGGIKGFLNQNKWNERA